jgi:hypothetical protein
MADDETTTEDIVNEGAEGVRDEGVVDYTRAVIFGGAATAGSYTLVEVIRGIPGTFLAPVRAFAGGLATFIGGTLGAPIQITDEGATTSAQSFADGTAALLGPLAFPVAVIVSVVGIYLFLLFLRRISVSPLQLIQERDG